MTVEINMARKAALTEKQRKFALELVTNEGRKTATECAKAAGYGSPRERAYELQNPRMHPLVVQHIGQLRDEYQKKYDITFQRHISELAKIRDLAREKGAWSAAVNAEVSRGKAGGLYVEQKIIRTGKLEDLSSEELENRMKEILEEYSPILEGVEVKELTEEVKQRQKKSRLQPQHSKPKNPKQTFDYSESYQPSESESSSSTSVSSSSSKPSSS